MASQYITVETEDGPMPTYESTPEGQSRGAVVVVQEAFGITSHIESITVRLADAGWRALAPALFHRQGSPVFGYDDFSVYAATLRPLGAAVTFYGGGLREGRFGLPSLIELAPSLQTPWLGLYGDQDKGIPAEDVEGLREAAKNAPVATEVVRYPDAEHGFNCNDRPSFNEQAAGDGWRRTLAWFDANLGA
jgi:carboxymethylenebutenolidase